MLLRSFLAPMKARVALACALTVCLAPAAAEAAPTPTDLTRCRLSGVEHDALCGRLSRPLDPARPQGSQIDIHFAVLPALARNKHPDPVFVLAGGPGQSAIGVAGSVARTLARLSNRRDIVFVDQRGTGRSAPLTCPELPPLAPLAESADTERQYARLARCRDELARLPHGDLRQYATWIAVRDLDAVRRALGAAHLNLVGGSYGTRAALEYMRQFPQAVRRAVLDGVAPPDMVLPAAFSTDSQAALEALFAACARDTEGCAARHPELAADWRRLLASLPREVGVHHPLSGAPERLTMTRDTLLGLVRPPLYVPALAAGLPAALAEATRGRFDALVGLGSGLGARPALRLAEGMHFSVVCAEDFPRLAAAGDVPGADFGASLAAIYQRVCADWPRAEVPAAFYTIGPAPAPTLVLSGGADPATPPRHGQRVASALGPRARHVVVREAGHGVMALPCLRDALFHFIDAPDEAAAMAVPADCARAVPRPAAYQSLRTAASVPGSGR